MFYSGQTIYAMCKVQRSITYKCLLDIAEESKGLDKLNRNNRFHFIYYF